MTELQPAGATYGELFSAAGRQVALAAVDLAARPMTGPSAAREAVAAYRTLLGAIQAHIRALFTLPSRLDAVAESVAPDPRDVAALQMVQGLQRFGRQRRLSTGTVVGPAVAWRAAAVSLAGATDLLRTHHGLDGEARTPQAAQLESAAVRAAGLAGVGDIARTVLAAERDLSLRAGHAGMTWVEVDRQLPDLTPLREAAWALASPLDPSPARVALQSWTVAQPGVRSGEPIAELSDRLLRLRRLAWQLTRERHVGIGTLSDLAAAAVTFHTHALAARSRGQVRTECAPLRFTAERPLAAARAAWAEAHIKARDMRTAMPPAGAVRADALAIRELCRTLMPLGSAFERAADPDLRLIIDGAARVFGDIAQHSARVLAELDATGQLYLSACSLTGAEVTDDPFLVRAKLRGDIVRVPHGRVRSLAQSYRSAQAYPADVSTAGPATPVCGRTPSASASL